ncbi:MAG: hypothetical protein M1829_006417 [Trizodia sp. TS-e1964]|nr:MAG: hypothetical protein M1829_006417 [Trizodia sp. TS-e1964]
MTRHHTPVFHYIGVFFLFAAAVLLLVASISAPVFSNLAILKVRLASGSAASINYGAFGYCAIGVPSVGDNCSPRSIGYSATGIIEAADNTQFSTSSGDAANRLTNALVLHPVACALAFLAFLLALGASCLGSLVAALIAFVAWLVTLCIMVVDFALFGIIKNHVNSDASNSYAEYSVIMWLVLVAMVLLFLSMFIVFFTCCSARRQRRSSRGKAETGYDYNANPTTVPARRRRFGIF